MLDHSPNGTAASNLAACIGAYHPLKATQDDVRRIALSLPETSEGPGSFRFFVKGKQFAWSWMQRTDPKKARVPNPDVIAVRVANDLEKQSLLGLDADKIFTESHYNGYPAVLVRLSAVDDDLLEDLLTDAWRCQAPKRLAAELETSRKATPGD